MIRISAQTLIKFLDFYPGRLFETGAKKKRALIKFCKLHYIDQKQKDLIYHKNIN